MPIQEKKNLVCQPDPEPSVGEIRFVGSGLAGSLDGVSDDLKRRLPDAVVDELLAGARSEEEIAGPGGVLAQLTKRLVERALEVELTDHLGYEPHAEPPGGVGNTRNGKGRPKTLITDGGPVEIRTPRDRDGSFEPRLVRKRQRRFEGFDEKILALYSRGLSTREIERFLHELYGVEVSRELISKVTDGVRPGLPRADIVHPSRNPARQASPQDGPDPAHARITQRRAQQIADRDDSELRRYRARSPHPRVRVHHARGDERQRHRHSVAEAATDQALTPQPPGCVHGYTSRPTGAGSAASRSRMQQSPGGRRPLPHLPRRRSS